MKTVSQAKTAGLASSAGRFLRIDDVIASTGLSRPTIYRMIANDSFPQQRKLTARSVGWWERDVNEWLRTRLAANSEPT